MGDGRGMLMSTQCLLFLLQVRMLLSGMDQEGEMMILFGGHWQDGSGLREETVTSNFDGEGDTWALPPIKISG